MGLTIAFSGGLEKPAMAATENFAAHNTARKDKKRPEIYLRIVFPDYNAIGPYGTAFLEAVQEHASIAAAARAKRVTYQRAWKTVRNLNSMFAEPLIATRQGRGGGANLTPAGKRVLALFRDAERKAAAVLRRHTNAFFELRSNKGGQARRSQDDQR